MNNLKFIEYSRKSSEAKEKQALSIQDQKAECKKYELREGLNVVVRLSESRSSFKPHNRPEFDKMIGLIKEGKVNAIVTWKPDRLCRNPEEGGIILQLLQDGVLKEIRTATGDVYTQESDHLILQIHFGMANQYSRNLSQNVRRGLEHKCERGEYPRPAPLGYESFGERGQRKMRPHPVEAPLVIKAFQLASTGGNSLSTICNQILEAGLKTKKGKKISKSHLDNLLRSSTYYGYFTHNEELFEGEYEPLITKKLFDEVQEALNRRSKPKIRVIEHVYNGLINCGECGCQVTTTVKTKIYKRTGRTANYIYNHCTHKKGQCSQEAINGKTLDNLLLEQAQRIKISQEDWELGIDLFKAKHQEMIQKQSKRLRYLQNQLTTVQNQINALVRMRANQELTKEEFMEQKVDLLNQKQDVKDKLNDNDLSADIWLELCSKYLNNAFSAKEIMESDNKVEKRNLILDVGENLFLKGGKLEFSFKQPYDVLLLPEYRTDMLPG